MPKPKVYRYLFTLALGALFSATSYLLWSHLYYKMGYPLDDAWIYQTYARNLSQLGEWSFIPGKASGGSTGPLWVLILFIGYLLQLDHHLWASLVGTLLLFGMGIVGMRAVYQLHPPAKQFALLAGLILVFEWHLVWAAVSGMETLLAALLATSALVYLLKTEHNTKDWFFIGLLIGISVWVRPDSITLLGPAFFFLFFGSKKPLTIKIKFGALIVGGFALPFGAYLLFNQITSGTSWPNTFYAKQAEYIERQAIPFAVRYIKQFILPLVGVGVILLPGIFYAVLKANRKQRWAILACILWFLGYLGMFAWRLPVTYQHGRYVIPAMPIFFILGLSGTLTWIKKYWQAPQMLLRVFSKVGLISCLIVTAMFWFLGAKAFAKDVAIIESEMVITAKWINENTDATALIAAHDIGALGYFSDRQLVDLAGLISPDIIPFIRDEVRLAAYLDTQGVHYLMTFPDWYTLLPQYSTLIYQTKSPFSPQSGGENMSVYKWNGSESQK